MEKKHMMQFSNPGTFVVGDEGTGKGTGKSSVMRAVLAAELFGLHRLVVFDPGAVSPGSPVQGPDAGKEARK